MFSKIANELPGHGGPNRSTINGNYSSPGGNLDMSKVLNVPPVKHEKYFTPQRLYITVPLDSFGKPMTQFTIQSKLLNPLPPNCMCHLESFSMNNFVGFTQPNLYGSFKASITAQTMSVGATPTLTIVDGNGLNFGAATLGALITFSTAEGYRYMGYISTNSTTAPIITIINPASSTAFQTGINCIPEHQYPVFNTGGTVAAQTVICNFTWLEAVGSGQNDIGKIQIELLDYTNPEVYDTATGTYSHIIGVVQTNNNTSTELDYYSPASINNAGYPITDPNLINNRQLSFRLTYATNNGNALIPQQAGQAQVYPYNLADASYFPLSGGNKVPWGGVTGSTGSYTGGVTPKTAQVFPFAPCIRFCLVFLPMYGLVNNYQ